MSRNRFAGGIALYLICVQPCSTFTENDILVRLELTYPVQKWFAGILQGEICRATKRHSLHLRCKWLGKVKRVVAYPAGDPASTCVKSL